jgi:hypothetical protein
VLPSGVAHLHRDRSYRYVLTCPAANALGCAGSANVTARIGGRTRKLSSSTLAIRAGGSVHVRRVLAVALRRVLGGRRRLAATVTVTQIDPQLKTRSERLKLSIVLRGG